MPNNNGGAFNDPNFNIMQQQASKQAAAVPNPNEDSSAGANNAYLQSMLQNASDAVTGGDYKAADKRLKDFSKGAIRLADVQKEQARQTIRYAKESQIGYTKTIESLNLQIKQQKSLKTAEGDAFAAKKKAMKDDAVASRNASIREAQQARERIRIVENTSRLSVKYSSWARQNLKKDIDDQGKDEERESFRVLKYGFARTLASSGIMTGTHRYGRAMMMESADKSVKLFQGYRATQAGTAIAGEEVSAAALTGGLGAAASTAGIGLALMGAVTAVQYVSQQLKKTYEWQVREGDLWKMTAAQGQNTNDFRSEMTSAVDGLGITREERIGMGESMRGMGKRAWGDFGSVLNSSAIMGRAYGMDLNSTSQFNAQMVREGAVSSSGQEQNKFALSVADAIGTGKMAGLEEEMLKGIQDLVGIGRSQSVNGPNALQLAGMMGSVSGSDFSGPGLKGKYAAQVIGSIDQSISNPKSPFGYLISSAVVQDMMREYGGGSGVVDGVRKLNYTGDVQLTRSQGFEAKFADGQQHSAEMLDKLIAKYLSASGGSVDYAMQTLSNQTGINMSQAFSMIEMKKHGDLDPLNPKSAMNIYGLKDMNLMNSPGLTRFVEDLGNNLRVTKGDKETSANKAIENLIQTLSTGDAKTIQAVYDIAKKDGKTTEEIVQAVASATQNIKSTNNEDEARKAVVDISQYVQSMTDPLIRMSAAAVSWFSGGSKKDVQEAVQASIDAKQWGVAGQETANDFKNNKFISSGNTAWAKSFESVLASNGAAHGSETERANFEEYAKAAAAEHMMTLDKSFTDINNDPLNDPKTGRTIVNAGFANWSGKGYQDSSLAHFLNSARVAANDNTLGLNPLENKLLVKDIASVESDWGNEEHWGEQGNKTGGTLRRILQNTKDFQMKLYKKDYIDQAEGILKRVGLDPNNVKLRSEVEYALRASGGAFHDEDELRKIVSAHGGRLDSLTAGAEFGQVYANWGHRHESDQGREGEQVTVFANSTSRAGAVGGFQSSVEKKPVEKKPVMTATEIHNALRQIAKDNRESLEFSHFSVLNLTMPDGGQSKQTTVGTMNFSKLNHNKASTSVKTLSPSGTK